MKSKSKTIIGIAAAGALLIVFAYTLYYLYAKNQEPDIVFKTETPVKTNIIQQTVATGSVVPRKEIEIKPQVSGIVQRIYVEAGDRVEENQTIAKIKVIPDMISLNNAENRSERAKIGYENAKRDFDRNKQLYENKVIALAEYQQFDIAFQNAKQELDAAEDNLQIVKEGVSKQAGKATNTLIRSTISGTILDVPVEEGNSVIESNTFNEGTTIASVADMSDMIFLGNVDESEVGKLKTGMNIILTIGAIENQTTNALLEYIAPKGILESGAIQFEIKAALTQNDSMKIRAGYSANAKIVLNRVNDVMAIKESLLTFRNDSVFVEVATGEQVFEKRLVELGLSDGIHVEVLSGLGMEDEIKNPNGTLN